MACEPPAREHEIGGQGAAAVRVAVADVDPQPLVGLGEHGSQSAIVVLECAGAKPRFIREDMLAAVRKLNGCAHVSDVMLHIGAFPVDRRHNAKIERERLAEWAAANGAKT